MYAWEQVVIQLWKHLYTIASSPSYSVNNHIIAPTKCISLDQCMKDVTNSQMIYLLFSMSHALFDLALSCSTKYIILLIMQIIEECHFAGPNLAVE